MSNNERTDRLEEIEQRVDAAAAKTTSWNIIDGKIQSNWGTLPTDFHEVINGVPYMPDAEVMIHARSDIQFLLKEIRQLERKVEDLECEANDLSEELANTTYTGS